MKKELMSTSAIVFIVGLLLSGCARSTVGPDITIDDRDYAAMRKLINEDPLFTSDPITLDDGDVVSFDGLSKIASPITPIAWGRRVTSSSREIRFENVNDTTVVATVTHTMSGNIIILAKSSPQDSVRRITKPFTDRTLRKLKFYRHGRTGDPDRSWRPGEASGAKGGTDGSEVTIKKVEVTLGTQTYVVTNPTDTFFKLMHGGGWMLPMFGPTQNVKVRVTLTSAVPDTDWVSLHRPSPFMGRGPMWDRPIHIRMRLVSEVRAGASFERVFENTWSTHGIGRHTFFVEALTRGSLRDDTAVFSSQLWGVPYIVQ